MRLDDLLGKRDEGEIPAEVAAELEILEAALRGDEVPAGMEGVEALVSDLRAERPEPEPRFGAELDAWAAAGFPRGERPGARASAGGSGAETGGLFTRLGGGGPRGWAPVAATAVAVVVAGVSVSQLTDFGGDDSFTGTTQEVPSESPDAGAAATPSSVPGAGDQGAEDFERAQPESAGQDSLSDEAVPGGASLAEGRSGASANRGQEKRRVERDAQLTLAAPAADVADVNDQVIDVVEGANGVVLNSQVTGTDESARATLEVRVPSATLDNTLAAMSELANVQSRAEAAHDITRTYVTAKDRLVGLRASRDNLAERIREATTDAEVAALRRQLAAVNRRIAAAKSELNEVTTRAQLATVTIVITSDGAGASDENDGWSFGDALDDAGKILEVGAGVALISAAVLVPLAIIAALAYFVVAAANRRARERALGE